MTPDFLKKVQAAGWAIEEVDEDRCTVRCPQPGCAMRGRFVEGGAVPRRDAPRPFNLPVRQFDDARQALRDRRQTLGLTIAEVEELAGIAQDHLAKFEKVDFVKPPNIETFLEWAAALGFDVLLQPADLPPITLRYISETRAKQEARQSRFRLDREADLRRMGRTR